MDKLHKYELLKDMQNLLSEYDGEVSGVVLSETTLLVNFEADWGKIYFSANFKGENEC